MHWTPRTEVFYDLHTLELSVFLPLQGKAVQTHLDTSSHLSFAAPIRAGLWPCLCQGALVCWDMGKRELNPAFSQCSTSSLKHTALNPSSKVCQCARTATCTSVGNTEISIGNLWIKNQLTASNKNVSNEMWAFTLQSFKIIQFQKKKFWGGGQGRLKGILSP